MRAARTIPHPDGGRVTVVEIPTPTPGPGEVLVKVKASGLNRGEILQAGRVRTGEPQPIGVEFAGVVAAVGSDVVDWREGDRVMGHGGGGQAEYTLASPLALMRVPDTLSWVDAAAFPNVFITAHDALITNGQLRSGETVLVNAASSGIGLAAIEIARAMGAGSVIATSRSPEKVRRLRELGVDCAVDLSTTSQAEAVATCTEGRGVDVVIDSVGGTVFEANLESLAVQGRLVNIGRLGSSTATIDLTTLWRKRLKLIGVTFQTRTEEERIACIQACARDLLEPLAAGRVRPIVDRTFGLDEIAAAHAYMSTDRHFGKIVLRVDDRLEEDAA